MKKYFKAALIAGAVALSLGLNLKQENAKDQLANVGLEFFSNQASAQTEKTMWGVAISPYYCGCPSGIAAGCYCIIF